MSAASTSAVLRHIPSELLEEILLKLPVKSLVRFYTVSKSWLSMISESRFVQEHLRRAAINGVKMMVTVPSNDYLDSHISICRIPPTSSMGIDDSTHLICPIEGDLRRVRAFCDGLWLVEAENVVEAENFRFDEPEKSRSATVNFRRLLAWKFLSLLRETKKSLYLWNLSTRTHRKLPDSLLPGTRTKFVYGLGYDSAADDYKVMKIAREESSPIQTELYSLKSDSWKTISPTPGIEQQERCEYVNGSFHWMRTISNTIVSFDLSTEECGEISFPAIALDSGYDSNYVEVVVTRGKLCVSVNSMIFNTVGFCFALWVMEEYGVEKSWTKVLNIEYGFSPKLYYPYGNLRFVYLYDNGDVLFHASDDGLYMYQNEGPQFKRILARDWSAIHGGFIYVESLVSPLPR